MMAVKRALTGSTLFHSSKERLRIAACAHANVAWYVHSPALAKTCRGGIVCGCIPDDKAHLGAVSCDISVAFKYRQEWH